MDGELTYQAWATNCENELPKLLPCPFCGGEADEYEGEYGNGIYCMECGAMVGEPIHLGFDIAERVSYEQAIEAWNTRADDYKQAAEYWQRMYEESFTERTCKRITLGLEREREVATVSWICSACRKHINKDHNYCHNCGAKVVSEE